MRRESKGAERVSILINDDGIQYERTAHSLCLYPSTIRTNRIEGVPSLHCTQWFVHTAIGNGFIAGWI